MANPQKCCMKLKCKTANASRNKRHPGRTITQGRRLKNSQVNILEWLSQSPDQILLRICGAAFLDHYPINLDVLFYPEEWGETLQNSMQSWYCLALKDCTLIPYDNILIVCLTNNLAFPAENRLLFCQSLVFCYMSSKSLEKKILSLMTSLSPICTGQRHSHTIPD